MKTGADFTLSEEFKLGNNRLVLVKSGRVRGREVEKEAGNRLEKIFSSLKQETYTVEEAKNGKLEEFNGEVDLKGNLRELLSHDKSFSGFVARLGNVIEDYQDNRERKGRIKDKYESIAQKSPLSDAKLYQGSEAQLEIEKTAEFLSRLTGKEINVSRFLENAGTEVVDKFVQKMIQRIGEWKDNSYDIRKLKSRNYYKIIVCSDNFVSNYLNKLVRIVSDGRLSSMGSKLKLLPGNVVLVESSGFQNRLEIRIPVELREDFNARPFQLIFKE